ncbi:RloB family protein [Leptospira sarikeiensis]|uniref:RloB domain-containing protein n=1 Tax=Leptospira sarikeiensis TaxID=2484943 RepID=A0A4R9KCM7_9LEPT|nr:RloB family protein [Leptospira sarikeiensis]TGL64682.1 RloB domain-containing protein [Leptospira sarikeiensis]
MSKGRRKPGARQVKKRVFIVCEGSKDKSEYAYISNLIKESKMAERFVEISLINTKQNTAKELVKSVNDVRDLNGLPDDEAWAVFDRDGYTKHPEAFDYARRMNVAIAFSSIAFEMWILLHFADQAISFEKCDDVIRYIKNKHKYVYDKSNAQTFYQLQNQLETAIKNATKLHREALKNYPKGTPFYEMNPYTDFHLLVERILNGFQEV